MGDEKTTLFTLVLASIVLIGLAVATVTGLAIVEQMSKAVRTPLTEDRGIFTDITGATNITRVAVGASARFPFLVNLDGCTNETGGNALTKTIDYTFLEGDENGGTILLTQAGNESIGANSNNLNCTTIRSLISTDAQVTADIFFLGIAIFGTFMGILVIGIIGRELLQLFRK